MEFINREVIVTTQLGKKYQGILASVAPDSNHFILRDVRIISPPSHETYDVLMFLTAQCSAMTLVQHPDPLQSIMKACDDKVADNAVIYSLKNEPPVYQKTQGIIQGMFASTARRGNNSRYNSHNGNYQSGNNGNHGYNKRTSHLNGHNNNRGNNQRQHQNENKSYNNNNKRRSNQQTQTTQTTRNNNQSQKGNKNSNQSSPSKSVRFQDQVKSDEIKRPQRLPQIPAKFVRDSRNQNSGNNRRNGSKQSRGKRSSSRRDNRSAQIPRHGILVPKIDAATGEAVKLAAVDDNFDFEKALELFKQLSTDDKKESDGDAKENENIGTKHFYDKECSFFDKLSSGAPRDAMAKMNRSIEAQRDMQTFGTSAYKGYVKTHRRRFTRRSGPQRKKFIHREVIPRQIGTQDKADAEQGKEKKAETVPKETKEKDELVIPTIDVRPPSPSPIPISC